MRSKELKSYNLDSGKTVIRELSTKPYVGLVTVVIVGIIISFTKLPIVYGATLIVVGLLVLFIFPNRVLVEFFDDFMVLYNRAEKNDCMIIYYDEIVSWWYVRGISLDELCIELEDGTIEKVNAYSKISFERYMNEFVKDKHRKTSK